MLAYTWESASVSTFPAPFIVANLHIKILYHQQPLHQTFIYSVHLVQGHWRVLVSVHCNG